LGEESVELYLCEESVLVDGADQSAVEFRAVLALQINENSSDSRILLHVVSRFFAIRANIAVTSSLNPHPAHHREFIFAASTVFLARSST